jgi:hypothetical protein
MFTLSLEGPCPLHLVRYGCTEEQRVLVRLQWQFRIGAKGIQLSIGESINGSAGLVTMPRGGKHPGKG